MVYVKKEEKVLFDYNEWKNAFSLLEAQIEKIDKNKYFNTINLQYYNYLNKEYKNYIMTEDYYEKYVGNKLFYGLEEEYFNYIYYIPKKFYTYRKMSFLSYSLRMVHYAIGLYLYKLTNEFEREFIAGNKSIKSWYGGKIVYTSKESVSINKDNLYYKKWYKEFSKELVKEIREDADNRIIIKLDIQDFYDNIIVSDFLRLLSPQIKFSVKRELKFDNNRIKEIADFYNFIMNGEKGLPQCDNDIISSYISNIYMKLIDIDILKIIKCMNIKNLKDVKIIQYCDDTYIVLDFDSENYDKDEVYIYVRDILQKISLDLVKKYNLKLNLKSKIFNLNINSDIKEILKSIKINSQEELELQQGEKPQEIINEILDEINKINLYNSDTIFEDDSSDIMKKIYSEKVGQVLKKSNNLETIEGLFDHIDFSKFTLSSKYIVTLACLNESTKNKLLKYIEEGNGLNKIFYALNYISKEDIEYRTRIKDIVIEEDYKNIFDFKQMDENIAGYNGLNKIKIDDLGIYDKELIINQIKKRRIAEKSLNYNIAFNHLVNEVKSILNFICSPDIEENDYKAINVRNDLIDRNISLDIIIKIVNMFDRRNCNTISHSNGEIVEKQEYFDYKKIVEQLLIEILN